MIQFKTQIGTEAARDYCLAYTLGGAGDHKVQVGAEVSQHVINVCQKLVRPN